MLGDCWLLTAMVALSEKTDLFEVDISTFKKTSPINLFKTYFLYQAVVPPNQSFEVGNGYTGAFLFKFWRYGKIVEV